MNPKVSIIILNWNGKEDTIECLESLKKITYSNYEILLVDNGSTDDSVECFRKQYPEIEIIENKKNLGFPEGNNVGIRKAINKGTDYVLLLNNDTTVDKNFLTELVNVAESAEEIGVVGPKIYYYREPQIIQTTGVSIDYYTGRTIQINNLKRDEEIDIFNDNSLLDVDYVYGACFLIKRKVIEEVGLLDPIYFLYGEETDWCIRIRKSGYSILCVLKSKIWHKSMASSSKVNKFSIYYPARNRVILMRKYASISQYISFLMFYPLYNFLVFMNNQKFKHIRYFYEGFIDGICIKIER